MAVTRYLGVDLAWREDRTDLPVNETGVAVIESGGQLLEAGWTHGVEETIAWANAAADGGDALMIRRRTAGGSQRHGPAAMRDASRPKVWPLEGQRQHHQHPVTAAGRCPLPESGRAGRLAVLRWPPRTAGRRPGHLGNLSLHQRWSAHQNSATTPSGPLQAQAARAPGRAMAALAPPGPRHPEPPPPPAPSRPPARLSAAGPGTSATTAPGTSAPASPGAVSGRVLKPSASGGTAP